MRPRRRAALLALVAVAAAGLALLRWFDLHPVLLASRSPRVAGAPVWRLGVSPVALLVRVPPSSPASFDAADWSWAWLNALEQEYGPVDVVDLAAPPPVLPAWSGAVVAGELSTSWRAALEPWVRAGGRLLIDGCAADPGWEDGTVDESRSWDDLLPAEAAAALAALAPGDPVARRGRVERGAVTRLSICAGRLLQSMQQGRPRQGFAVVERAGAEHLLTPVDLSVLPAELAEVPVTDLLERRLLEVAFSGAARVGLWYVPEGRPGAYLPSHDEEGFGDRTLYQADHERDEGARSTFFIMPGEMTPAALASLCDDGFDVGLHWDRGYPEPRQRRVGLWRVRPFLREITLEEQLADLQRSLPEGCVVTGNRNHGLLWTGDYAGTLERLAAAGLRYDSTYGPDGDRYGYVFGTALPFRPLDADGLPLPLLEVPFHFQDDERFERAFLPRFLDAAANGHHGHVGLLAHPTTMGYRPSVDRFDAWIESYGEARSRGLWIGTIAQVVDFWSRRAASRVSPAPDGLHVELAGADQWLWVRPAGTGVLVDGKPRTPERILRPTGAADATALYPLEPGKHRVTLR